LHVSGFIRRDVVLQPGAIDWGTVDAGNPMEQTLHVSYAGREDWRILDVKTADPHFEVEMSQPMRAPGRISYDLLVRLTKDAPVGYVKDQLILVTNDAQSREIPVDMEGRVVADITINPTKWFIGVVHPGQKVTKNLLVRGKKPFRITEVDCANKAFAIAPSKEAKAVHLIPVVFTAGTEPGRVTQTINIHTDQGGNSVQACTAYAEVVKSDTAKSDTTKSDTEKPATAKPTADAPPADDPPQAEADPKAEPEQAEAPKSEGEPQAAKPEAGSKAKWTASRRSKNREKAAEQPSE
jgi:hypothetical protein